MKLQLTQLVSDPLNGANVSPLPNPPWTTPTLFAPDGLQILNHEAVTDDSLSGASSYTGISWPNDQWASVDIDFLAVDANLVPTVALNLRCQDTVNQYPYYQLAAGRPTSDTIDIYLNKVTIDGGIIGEVVIPWIAHAPLLLAVIGSVLYAYYNGVLAFQVTDSEIPSGSFMSLEIIADQAVTDAQASNFKGGFVSLGFEGCSTNWLYGQGNGGLAVYISPGIIAGAYVPDQVFMVPDNATTYIWLTDTGLVQSGPNLPLGVTGLSKVVSGPVKTGFGASSFSPGIQSITDLRV